MVNLFVYLFLLSFGLLIISLVEPGLINRLIKQELTRKKAFLIFGSLTVILFVMIGIFTPVVQDKKGVLGESEKNRFPTPVITEIYFSPTLFPTAIKLSPAPIIKNTPTSTPKPLPTSTPLPTVIPTVYIPPPTAKSTTQISTNPPPQLNCDPSYPSVCIPKYPPDLDCPEVPYDDFTVLPPDPHGFDRDNDGVGCET